MSESDPMNPVELSLLASAWVAYWRSEEGTGEREQLNWATAREWDLVRHAPEDAWQLILAILACDNAPEIQEVLSAGPLEDLLAYHGPTFIERVERQARTDPEFAALLGGVWQNAMSEEVWARVQAVWDRRGWDGGAKA
jgi:hypothetical protein